MAKRFGRTVITTSAARQMRFDQACRGSDHADLAGDCESPILRPFVGVRDESLATLSYVARELATCPWQDHAPGVGWAMKPVTDTDTLGHVVNVDAAVPCRKCANCLRRRAQHWRLRAEVETMQSVRTWFGTLTLSPAEHFKAAACAASSLASTGLDFESLTASDQFRCRDKAIAPQLRLFLKRVRKNSGQPIKYLLVCEAHKSGLPHYHILIHEISGPVRHNILVAAWKLGFSKFNLVADRKAASYVCKYLSKSAEARVRASGAYGQAISLEQGSPSPDHRERIAVSYLKSQI